jgi:anti-anti-sigma factor
MDREGDVIVHALSRPRLGGSELEELRALSEAWLTRPSPRVVLDLRTVEFADSTFLGQLVSLRGALRARGGDLKLAVLQHPLLRVIRLMRLDRIFEIHPTAEAALASYT